VTRDEFNRFCGSLKAATNVVQWGNASVWKVGGKIFAVCSHWGEGDHQKISFKCGDTAYDLLREVEGIVPAPYLARAKWVQVVSEAAMPDEDLTLYLQEAHAVVARKLTRVQRRALGLDGD